MLAFLRKQALRLSTADTAALFVYNIPTGTINLCFERYVAHISMGQWGATHLIYNIIKFSFAFVAAFMTKKLRELFHAAKGTERRRWVDALGLALYQVPLLFAVMLILGRTERQIILCLEFSLAEHAVFGPYHGMAMDWCERRFSNGTKPP